MYASVWKIPTVSWNSRQMDKRISERMNEWMNVWMVEANTQKSNENWNRFDVSSNKLNIVLWRWIEWFVKGQVMWNDATVCVSFHSVHASTHSFLYSSWYIHIYLAALERTCTCWVCTYIFFPFIWRNKIETKSKNKNYNNNNAWFTVHMRTLF